MDVSEEIRIRETELRKLLAGKDTADQALATYFDIDESKPFAPEYVLKPEVKFIIPSDTDPQEKGLFRDTVVGFANSWSRRDRKKRYEQIREQFPDRIRLVAEGDSWFQHPLVNDTIDHLFNHFAVCCVSAGGDELSNMFKENEYLPALIKEDAKALLLSGGGNDLLGDRFVSYLKPYSPGTDARRFLTAEFSARLEDMIDIYQSIFQGLQKRKPDVVVFTHGYDYAIPQAGNKGKWLGKAMRTNEIQDPTDQRAIVRTIIDEFNNKMIQLTNKHQNAVFVDVRQEVREVHWYDEIHPDSDGFQQVSIKFKAEIENTL